MFDPFMHWRRYAAAGSTMQATAMNANRTLSGAGDVIAARGAIIGDAAQSPWTADYVELGRMVPEKLDALSRSGSAAALVMWDSQSIWLRHIQHLGILAMRGRPLTSAEIVDLAERSAMLMLRSAETSAKLGAAVLAPFSRQVQANVRRLGASKKTSARRGRTKSH